MTGDNSDYMQNYLLLYETLMIVMLVLVVVIIFGNRRVNIMIILVTAIQYYLSYSLKYAFKQSGVAYNLFCQMFNSSLVKL